MRIFTSACKREMASYIKRANVVIETLLLVQAAKVLVWWRRHCTLDISGARLENLARYVAARLDRGANAQRINNPPREDVIKENPAWSCLSAGRQQNSKINHLRPIRTLALVRMARSS